jgi:hypothetical protein
MQQKSFNTDRRHRTQSIVPGFHGKKMGILVYLISADVWLKDTIQGHGGSMPWLMQNGELNNDGETIDWRRI